MPIEKTLDKDKLIATIKSKPQLKTLEDTEVEWFLDSAVRKCLNLAFPFDKNATEERLAYPYYERWLIDATISMVQSIGVGNIKSYSQNGYSISYVNMTDGLSEDLINQIIPKAGTI